MNVDFDEALKALRGNVVPKSVKKRKADCTPEEWAGHLDYYKKVGRRWRGANPGKACDPERQRKWRAANPDKARATKRKWRAANLEKYRQSSLKSARKWKAANPEKASESIRKWRKAHPEKVREYSRRSARTMYAESPQKFRDRSSRWRADNPEKKREGQRKWQNNARKTDPDFKLRQNLRNRLNKAIDRNAETGSAVRDLGCTVEELWAHLESQFQPGMTRMNMGTVWEIDHFFPLSKAKMTESRAGYLAANNWRNLQPLTVEENNAKGDAIYPEAQELFDQLKAEFSSYDEAHGEEVVPF